jgi:hypothetical protein
VRYALDPKNRRELYMVAKSFEPLYEFSRSSRGIEPVKVIASEFRVCCPGLKYLKRDY